MTTSEPTAVAPEDFAAASLARLTTSLHAAANAADAAQMKRYMRDQFEFLGVKSPAASAAMQPIIADARGHSGDAIVAFAQACWQQEAREYQYAGAVLLRKHVDVLDESHLDDVRELVQSKSWWDTIDTLASHTVGAMVTNHPSLVNTMDDWIDDDDMWLRRTAILHQLGYKERTDQDRLFRYCLERADETEFFIRKAIGWALRQYARVAPNEVRAFVLEHDDRWSGLTRREALKHLG